MVHTHFGKSQHFSHTMAMDLSLRHLPDLSEASPIPGFPEASFQIPSATNTIADCLLMADSSDFFAGMNNATLTSPAKPPFPARNNTPLTLEELTPRSRRLRKAPIRSSLKPRPVIPSPLKDAVTHDLSIALGEALSPLKSRDTTFAIPGSAIATNRLLEDNSDFLKDREADTTYSARSNSPKPHDPLTLSQLTPAPARNSIFPPLSSKPAYTSIFDALSEDLKEYHQPVDSLICRSGGDARQTSSSSSSDSVTDSVQVVVESKPPLPGSTNSSPEIPHVHVVPQETVSERGVSARSLRKTGRQKTDCPNGSNTDESKKRPKANPKRTVIAGGITKRTGRKVSASSGFARILTKSGNTSNTNGNLGSDKGAVVKETNRNTLSNSKENVPENPSTTDAAVPVQSGGLAALLMSYGAQPAPNSKESNLSPTGQNLPCGSQGIKDQGGHHVPDQLRHETSPRSAQAANSQLPSRPDPGEDSSRNQPDETQRHLSHMSPRKEKLKGTTARRTPDSISDSNLTCQQVHIPSGVSALVHAETPDPASSVVPPSPMRPSVKRATSAAPSRERLRKKSRGSSEDIPPITFTHSSPELKDRELSSNKPPPNPLRPSRVKNAASVSSSSRAGFVSSHSMTTRGGSKSHSKPGVKNRKMKSGLRASKAKTLAPRSCAPSSGDVQSPPQFLSAASSTGTIVDRVHRITASSSDSRADGKSGGYPHAPLRNGQAVPHPDNHREAHNLFSASEPGPSFKPGNSSSSYRLNKSLPPAKPTVPIAFHFHSEARIEARKAESEERPGSSLRRSHKTQHGTLTIPDFKALHALHESGMAARREHIAPTIPVDFEFSTNIRAQEREKFEEGRRAREQEAERLAEEQRRLLELEEEKEIKEMRKRAVPKANEIPEWYAHAPKRSHKEGKLEKAGSSVSS